MVLRRSHFSLNVHSLGKVHADDLWFYALSRVVPKRSSILHRNDAPMIFETDAYTDLSWPFNCVYLYIVYVCILYIHMYVCLSTCSFNNSFIQMLLFCYAYVSCGFVFEILIMYKINSRSNNLFLNVWLVFLLLLQFSTAFTWKQSSILKIVEWNMRIMTSEISHFPIVWVWFTRTFRIICLL